MKSLKTLFIIFGLFIQTCLSANVETDKYDSNFDENTKTVTKREYYAPEYKHDQYSYPAYRFEYGVHDPHTGDIKKQYEERDGDTVRGYYSLVEPDGSIRLVEYTADSKNGFQATVKKIGYSHHPTTVTHHLNTANGHHNGDNAGYAPDYHGGQHYGGHHFGVQHYGGEHERPSIQPIYNNRYEPPAYSNHYEQPQPALPVYANHYEPRPAPPAYNGHHVFNNNYYHQHAPQNVYHHEPPVVPGHNHFQQPPSLPSYNHYEPSHVAPVHYEPSAHPETADYEHEAPALFAGGLPTIHGDYGSASTEEYYPAPLQFPVVSNVKNFGWADKDDDRQHRISLNDYQFPATRDGDEHHVGVTKNGPVDRPEYLRKYFEPEHRDHADVNSYFDESDDDSKK